MLALAAFIGLLHIPTPTFQFSWAQGPGDNIIPPNIFPPDSAPYGLTYGDWTAKWWQWAYSLPTENNPLLDETGEDCAQAQNQTGPVWFLAGTAPGSVERTCTIPAGKAILFPIINTMDFRLASETEAELRASSKDTIDKVTTLEASIDGMPLQNLSSYRIQSQAFNVTFPNDNVLGVPEGTYLAVAEGYWVFLEPLPPGQHEIHFRGTLVDPTATSTQNFETEVTYNLVVSDAAMPITEQATNTTVLRVQAIESVDCIPMKNQLSTTTGVL
jgi:hypothetical protein